MYLFRSLLFVILHFLHATFSSFPKPCSEYLKSNPSVLRLDDTPYSTKKDLSLNIQHTSPSYHLRREFFYDAALFANHSEHSYFCLSLKEVKVLSESSGSVHALTDVTTFSTAPVGYLRFNTTCLENVRDKAQNFQCMDVFHEESVLHHGMFTYSTLEWEFWNHLKYENVTFPYTVTDLNIETYLGSIPSSWIENVHLKDLQNLYIRGNDWGRPSQLFSTLPNLKLLFLMNNSIEEFPNDTFNKLEHVESLHLQHNKLVRLPQGLTNVKIINLSNQQTNTTLLIPDETISTWKNITNLQINTRADVNISSLFRLPQLQSLHCKGCFIRNITDVNETFTNTKLTFLELSFNNISELPVKSFNSLNSLSVLSLGNNWFETCPCSSLKTLKKLRRLVLSNNVLSKIESYCFSGLQNLQTLDLSGNRLTFLENSLFENLSRLLYLHLSHNYINIIQSNTFLPLQKLVQLYISHNNLTEAPILSPSPLGKVDLSYNFIKLVTSNSTRRVVFVQIFDLSNNEISDIEIHNVRKLNISHNSLRFVTEKMWKYFENLSALDVGGNKFDCCHENITFLQQKVNASKNILKSNGSLTCITGSSSGTVVLETFINNGTLCSLDNPDHGIEIGVPLAILALCIILFSLVAYYYQFEFIFVTYFIRVKKRGLIKDDERLMNCVYDAFVCYSGKSFKWIAEELLPNLENSPEAYRFCLHDRDFTLGVTIDKNIVQSLNKSRKVIFVVSKEFVGSTWCQWELTMANHKMLKESRNFIIIIELERLDQKTLPINLKQLMDTRTYLEWPENPNDKERIRRCWERLRDALGESIFKETGKNPPSGTVMEV